MNENPIAQGRTAEIYAGQAEKVLKVYRTGFSRQDAMYEAEIASKVQAAGIACPRFYEMTEFQGRPALVYERFDGPTMAELVFKGPWRIPRLARRMARLHQEIHTPTISLELPSQREKYTRRIETSDILPADLKKTLLERYAALPDEHRLCHGDFHPGNILSPNGRDLTIDWIDVSIGHPLADVARTSILLLGMSATISNPLIQWVVTWFHGIYLEEYFSRLQTSPKFDKAQSNLGEAGREWTQLYRAFLPIVAAARLAEGIPELQDWLVTQAARARSG